MKKIYLVIVQLLLIGSVYAQQGWRNTNYQAVELGGGVNISWAAINETNMESYQIERSGDGHNFLSIGSLMAQNRNSTTPYTFRDATPIEGVNYYRIRSTNSAGGVFYSDVIRIDRGYRRTDVRIYPNPVSNGIVRLQMNNIPSGRYAVMIYNTTGRQVYNQSMVLSEGTSTQFINLPATMNKGMYIVQVTNGASRVNTNLVVN